MRKTLGVLLAEQIGVELRRAGSGDRMTFVDGEKKLSGWMATNAYVAWVEFDRPWELENHLIATLDVPLNLGGNSRNTFHHELFRARAAS